MKSSGRVLVVVLALLGVPPLLALVEAVSFHARNRNNGSILSSGVEREYLLYVPESYDPGRPTPLVLSLHGGGGWPVQQRDLSEWNQVAEAEGFLVVYPAGVEAMGFSSVWRAREGEGLESDVRFIGDLIDGLQQEYNIDQARIYANGLSNGGAMSFVLSCTLSDRIAAVGLVGAAHLEPFDWCKERRAVPMIGFHGTDDPVVPYEGGTSWIGPVVFPDAEEWAAAWARRNRCEPSPDVSQVAIDVSRSEYPDCSDGASVVLYTIHGGGHTWPGGPPLPKFLLGSTTSSIEATRLMWPFFEAHPMPGATVGSEVSEQFSSP